jgi:CRISPR-associated protein Csb3
MTERSIPVDLLNPGQVFACLGFMEAAEVLCGNAEGVFDWSAPEARFHLRADGDEDPFATTLDFLARASIASLAPVGSSNQTDRPWRVPTARLSQDEPFPFPDPDSPATLPARLQDGDRTLVIDYWGDATRRDNVKFWAGSAGCPGAAFLRDSVELVRSRLGDAAADPFAVAAAQSGSFRFDWRRDYIPLDTGFSLNKHSTIQSQGYPLVEILAAIGVSNARPERPHRSDKLQYRYGVLGRRAGSEPLDDSVLPLLFHRAALGCAELPFPMRTFHMNLDWPGQANQARCITTVTEEIHA